VLPLWALRRLLPLGRASRHPVQLPISGRQGGLAGGRGGTGRRARACARHCDCGRLRGTAWGGPEFGRTKRAARTRGRLTTT